MFNGCPFEIDSVWGITWPNTERNSTNVQLCPGGHDALGMSCIIIMLLAAAEYYGTFLQVLLHDTATVQVSGRRPMCWHALLWSSSVLRNL